MFVTMRAIKGKLVQNVIFVEKSRDDFEDNLIPQCNLPLLTIVLHPLLNIDLTLTGGR